MEPTTWIFVGIVIVVVVLVLVTAAVKIVPEWERGVIFRLGRLSGVKGPGLFVIIPFVDRMKKVDLRIITMDVPSQEAITQDNVTVKVNAVVYFRVINPADSVVKVFDHITATSKISQTTLRSVVGQSTLDECLGERDKLNAKLQQIIDEQTEPWGVKVSVVEMRDVELPESMQRAIAAQAEAERERRAKVVHAEGEFEAAKKLTQAAAVIATQPSALQLRYLQTLTTIATERTNTVVFPLPLDIMSALLGRAEGSEKKAK